ncbi:hypothetical protein BD779DRAFT_1391320, partial [Infundibulicybe gibba]
MFSRNSEMIGGDTSRKDKARQLMTKIINNLSAKVEMGSPMVCMYLLGNPDHYTGHSFALFYWQSYVREARKAWDQELVADNKCESPDKTDDFPDKIALLKRHGRIIGLSPVHDYIYRPVEISGLSLYNWVRRCRREKLRKKQKCAAPSECSGSSSSTCESETDEIDESATSMKNGLFPFLESHPLAGTHGTRVISESKGLVPNFVGRMLPR